MRRHQHTLSTDTPTRTPRDHSMGTQTPKPQTKPPRLRMFESLRLHIKKKCFRLFIKNSAIYIVPILEAVHGAADVFPPLKSAAGGALTIARALQVGLLPLICQRIAEVPFKRSTSRVEKRRKHLLIISRKALPV